MSEDIVERPDPTCPCCGAAEPDWNGPHAEPSYIDRDAELDRLRARVAELEAGLRRYGRALSHIEASKLAALIAGEDDPGPSTLAAEIDTRASASGRSQPAPESE